MDFWNSEVEGLEGGSVRQTRVLEPVLDEAGLAVLGVGGQRTLDQAQRGGALLTCPGHDVVERLVQAGQPQDLELLAHASLEGGLIVLAHAV